MHRWRNSTNLDQLMVAAASWDENTTDDESGSTVGTPRNSCTSTDTLTSSQSALQEIGQSATSVQQTGQSTTSLQETGRSTDNFQETGQSTSKVHKTGHSTSDLREADQPTTSIQQTGELPARVQETEQLTNGIGGTSQSTGIVLEETIQSEPIARESSQSRDAGQNASQPVVADQKSSQSAPVPHKSSQSQLTVEESISSDPCSPLLRADYSPAPENSQLNDGKSQLVNHAPANANHEVCDSDVSSASMPLTADNEQPVEQSDSGYGSSVQRTVTPTKAISDRESADTSSAEVKETSPVKAYLPASDVEESLPIVAQSPIPRCEPGTGSTNLNGDTQKLHRELRNSDYGVSADTSDALAEIKLGESEESESALLQMEVDAALENLDRAIDAGVSSEGDTSDVNERTVRTSSVANSVSEHFIADSIPVASRILESATTSEVTQPRREQQRVVQQEEAVLEQHTRTNSMETGEIVETILPESRVAKTQIAGLQESEESLPVVSAGTSEVTALVQNGDGKASPVAENAMRTEVPEPPASVEAREVEEVIEPPVLVSRRKKVPPLNQTSKGHQRPPVQEEVVEKIEKVHRNRMTSKDIEDQIGRQLANIHQKVTAPSSSSSCKSVVGGQPAGAAAETRLLSPPATPSSEYAAAAAAGWQYQLPAPPTPFADAGRPAVEAPLQFQDSETVTSSELSAAEEERESRGAGGIAADAPGSELVAADVSQTAEVAEATNADLIRTRATTIGHQSVSAAQGDASDGAELSPPERSARPDDEPTVAPPCRPDDEPTVAPPCRPEKPERRRPSDRVARQMSFSIGAYGQREPAAHGHGGGGAQGRLQKAESFHIHNQHQLSQPPAAAGHGKPVPASSVHETSDVRRALTRRRSSDAAEVTARGHARSSEATDAEPVRPPRKYELRFNNSKSCSMMNLSGSGTMSLPLERSPAHMGKTQSQSDLAAESEVTDIQSEFLKLQRQFLHWQQQLLHNQTVLQTKVAPLAARPAQVPPPLGRPAAASLQSLQVIEELRARESTSTAPAAPPAAAAATAAAAAGGADYSSRSQSLPRAVSARGRPPAGGGAAGQERQTADADSAAPAQREPPQHREKRVPFSPPRVALGSWKDQGRAGHVQLKEDRDYVLRHPAFTSIAGAAAAADSERDSRRSSTGAADTSRHGSRTSSADRASVERSNVGRTNGIRDNHTGDSETRRSSSTSSAVGLRQAAEYVSSVTNEQEEPPRRAAPVSVRQSKSVTVTSLGATPPPVSVPVARPQPQQPLSAVAKVRQNTTVSEPKKVLSPPAKTRPAASAPSFTIADSKSTPVHGGRPRGAGKFTSVVSLTDEPKHTISVQVSKNSARTKSSSELRRESAAAAAAAARPAGVSRAPPGRANGWPSGGGARQVAPAAAPARSPPSVVSVTRKDSATLTETAASRPAADASWRSKTQPVVKGFRTKEAPPASVSVPAPPPPPPPVLPSLLAGRAQLKPVASRGRGGTTGGPGVPKLDPREELMIAIREHGGLKSMRNTGITTA